ncbi:4Fe-4S binding protein [Spirochaetota bacterium]
MTIDDVYCNGCAECEIVCPERAIVWAL